MKSNASSWRQLLLVLAVFTVSNALSNQSAKAQGVDIETRAYRVNDILMTIHNYGFGGIQLPGAAESKPFSMGGGFGGGGLGGGMGAAGGGGVFSIPDHFQRNTSYTPQGLGGSVGGGLGGGGSFGMGSHDGFGTSDEIDVSNIVDLITELLEISDPAVFDQGSIQAFGNSTFIATVSKTNHALIDQHLQMLRKTYAQTARQVSVKVTWLQINEEQYRSLNVKTENGLNQVSQSSLDRLSEHSASGTLTCFDGQTTHMIGGELRNWLKSLSPVVGSHSPRQPSAKIASRSTIEREPFWSSVRNASSTRSTLLSPATQEPEAEQPDGIGYSPVTGTINYGTLIELTPRTLPGQDQVIVDVHSNVLMPRNESGMGIRIQNVAELDRLNILNHQFSTSLKLPLNQPIVVGGSNLKMDLDMGIYVVLEVNSSDD